MNVELPGTGCNIINSSTSFYNYSPDSKTRETYIIYEGVPILQSSTYNQYGYSYSGTCLTTGSLVYRPELQIEFSFYALSIIAFIIFLIYRLIIKRLLP